VILPKGILKNVLDRWSLIWAHSNHPQNEQFNISVLFSGMWQPLLFNQPCNHLIIVCLMGLKCSKSNQFKNSKHQTTTFPFIPTNLPSSRISEICQLRISMGTKDDAFGVDAEYLLQLAWIVKPLLSCLVLLLKGCINIV